MKRFLAVMLSLFSILSLSSEAIAGRWVQKEIYWSKAGSNPASGAVMPHDTAFAPSPFKTSGGIDTTGKFTLRDADVWRTAHAAAVTTVDTVIAGFLLIAQDSTGAVRPTVTAVTVEIDGRIGGLRYSASDTLSVGWVQVDSLACTFVNNFPYNQVISIPIRTLNGLGGTQPGGNGPENFLSMPHRIMAFEDLRARITSVTGIMSGNLRAFIRYWDSDSQD